MSVDNRPTLTLYGKSLITIVIIFGSVSATTMVIFCLSLTTDPIGKTIATFIGLGLVLAKYVFAAKFQQDKSVGHYDPVTIIVTAIIFAVSIMGTWSWLESEFNTNNKTSILESESYLDNRTLIEMKTITAQSHLDQAKTYSEKGNYTTQAKNSTKEANKALAELQVLINKSSELPATTTGNSSQDMGTALGNYRFLVWLGLALIINLCAVTALFELKKLSGLPVAPKESDTIGSDSLKGDTHETNTHKDATLTSTTNIVGWQPESTGTVQPLSPPRNDERYSMIRHCVMTKAVKLGKNAIQTKYSLGTKTVDKYFEWMMQENIIQRSSNGRTYELISNEEITTTQNKTMARAT